jgi:hypothetical protein
MLALDTEAVVDRKQDRDAMDVPARQSKFWYRYIWSHAHVVVIRSPRRSCDPKPVPPSAFLPSPDYSKILLVSRDPPCYTMDP